MHEDIVLRPAEPRDDNFLMTLYGTTRPEVTQLGWDEAAQFAFVRMQFDMQTRSYAAQYPASDRSVIIYRGEAAGRIIVDRHDTGFQLVDIAVMPAFRGKGIATSLIQDLQHEASERGLPVGLSVERANSNAFGLYRKLGFEVNGEGPVYLSMQWTPRSISKT